MSNCRNSPVYCPISAVAAETVRDQERSVVFGRFRTSFGGQVVSDSRLPPSSGHLLRRDRGGGRSYCEGIPPAGGACAPRKGSYNRVPLYILYGKPSPCTYYSERRWGMCPKKKGRLGCEASNITKYRQPTPKTRPTSSRGKKWHKNCDEPNLIRSFLISKAT